eukprot:gnl/Spiro4/24475_TR12129_c0_g1_i1.p1 gnl/Spiro4/24475_TR12129_c0_g1~~gnl/Spiro4/24475_TR12129_c0_g1_i1.p1  ORF type:complete len:416 (+),score=89.32 gnl/Spiro4/24475_TR12129_c0_g1_i1:43-1248(+)
MARVVRLLLLLVALSALLLPATSSVRRSRRRSSELPEATTKKDVAEIEDPSISITSLEDGNEEEDLLPPSVLPRRTFLHTVTNDDLGPPKPVFDLSLGLPPPPLALSASPRQWGSSRAYFRRDFGPTTTSDTDFCFALFPAGYITDELLRARREGSDTPVSNDDPRDLLEVAELQTPEYGYYKFSSTIVAAFIGEKYEVFVRDESDKVSEDGSFKPIEPDSATSYLIENPYEECSCEEAGAVATRMRELYQEKKHNGVALQLGEVGCTMASFDMLVYGVRGRWLNEVSVGGIAIYGGRTAEEQKSDFKRAGLERVRERDLKLPQAIQDKLAELGPALVSHGEHGHVMILDEVFIKNGKPLAIFVRDPMNGLAFAVPWSKAKPYVSFRSLTFGREKKKEADD